MVSYRSWILFASTVVAAITVAGCSKPSPQPNNSAAPIDTVPPASDPEQRRRIAQRFNERAKIINADMRDSYERGQAVCARLKRYSGRNEEGCPRPKPNYVEMMSMEAPH